MLYDIIGSIVMFKNDRKVLRNAIDSFLNTSLKVKLFLIDNSPTDGLHDIISDNRVEYIFNPSNPGFGAAHNLAIEKSLSFSKYHLVLNPDVYFSAGNLEKMFDFMESNQNIGQLMPKILYPDGEMQYLCKTNPTPLDLFVRRFLPKAFKGLFEERLKKYELRDRNYNHIIYDVSYLSGCFMFFRTSILKEVGLFDERIFMYIEDADLTRRMLLKARTVYYPEAFVYHHYGKGSYKDFKLMWYNIKSAIFYFNKWGWT
jgi:GT2 family glycosyltransferase